MGKFSKPCKCCKREIFPNRPDLSSQDFDAVKYGFCSIECAESVDPGIAEKIRADKERGAKMEKAVFFAVLAVLGFAATWYWGLRKKCRPAFYAVTAVLVAVAVVLLCRGCRANKEAGLEADADVSMSLYCANDYDRPYVQGEERTADSPDLSEWERAAATVAQAVVDGDAHAFQSFVWEKSFWNRTGYDNPLEDRLLGEMELKKTRPDSFLVGTGVTPKDGLGKEHGRGRVSAVPIVFCKSDVPYRVAYFQMVKDGEWKFNAVYALERFTTSDGKERSNWNDRDLFAESAKAKKPVQQTGGSSKPGETGETEPKAELAPEPAEKTAPEEKAEPKAKPAPGSAPAPKPGSTPTPAKKTTLTDLADRQATAYKEGTKTVEQIIEVIKSPKLTEPQRKRLRELLEERGVPLAEAERKAREEAKRKAVEAKRQAAEEAKRKAAEEAEARRKAAEEAEARRKAAEEAEAKRKEAEFKERRQKAEAERLKRQEEDRKRREEADRLAKEEAEREQKRKDEEDRNRQKALDEIAKSMQKLSEAAARMDGRDDEEDDEEEEEEEDADTPFFRSGGVQTETLLEERRAVVEEQRRRAAAAEAQRRAAAAEAQRRAAAAEAQRRAAEQRKREEARKAQQMAAQADPYAISPFSGDGTIEDDEPQQLVPSVRSATPPAMPDAMVEQLAAGIKMSVQGGQMTAAQAAFMLDNATLSAAQKAKVRKLLAAEGIKLPGGK